jgi:hypothetical protein
MGILMADKVKIDLQENAPHRVALELAVMIRNDEMLALPEKKKTYQADPRAYWFALYHKCRKIVVDGASAE